MANSHLQSKIKSTVFCLLSFVLSVCLFLITVCTILMLTVFNRNYILDCMNSSNYFSDKSAEITVSLTDLGYASGLDEEFFEEFVDEVMVSQDTNKYLEIYYSFEDSNADITDFKQKFNEAITAYAEANNIESVDNEGREILVKEAGKIYENSIELPYFGKLFPYFKAVKQTLPFIIGGLVVFSAIIIFVFFKANHWKHRAVRYICYATSGAFLAVGIIPAYLLITGAVKYINLSSRALYNTVISITNGLAIAMLAVAIFLLLISVGLFVKHKLMRKKQG
ncbi:MAG: hypothetical protein UHD05_07080 [Ruminococcus sp.]|nr:hypothetical protein [Ruminococcus sp.]